MLGWALIWSGLCEFSNSKIVIAKVVIITFTFLKKCKNYSLAARALIIHDRRVLFVEMRNDVGAFYILPGAVNCTVNLSRRRSNENVRRNWGSCVGGVAMLHA